jgi:hypothetical protein
MFGGAGGSSFVLHMREYLAALSLHPIYKTGILQLPFRVFMGLIGKEGSFSTD